MVRTIHDARFGLGGRLQGVVAPLFRRTLRENPHPAHRECETSWGHQQRKQIVVLEKRALYGRPALTVQRLARQVPRPYNTGRRKRPGHVSHNGGLF